MEILVIGSRMVSMALGMIVLEAAEALAQGKSRQEGSLTGSNTSKRTSWSFFTVGDLENLSPDRPARRASGPVFGSLVNKPVLTIDKGGVIAVEKIRGNLGRIHRPAFGIDQRAAWLYAGEDLYPSCRRFG